MTRIVVAGGGIVGLSLAMMLTKQGHEVTVLERDDGGVPGEGGAVQAEGEAGGALEASGTILSEYRQYQGITSG